MSRPGIIKAAGREWVAGFTWRSFAHYPTKQERREDAQLLGADWVAFRTIPDVTQAGFCSQIHQRATKRLYSLAAAVAMEYPQPWQGIFQISETLWWYIAVRDGQAILPDGDVIGDYDSIIAAQARHETYNDWTVQTGTLEDLSLILEFSSKANGLSPIRTVNPQPLWKILAPFIGLALVVIVACILYQRYERQVHAAEQRALLIREASMHTEISPLAALPMPNTWLAACENLMQSISVSDSGWSLANLTCYTTHAVVLWQRQKGTTLSQRPQGDISIGGNEIVQTLLLGPFPAGSTTLQPYQLEDTALYTLLQPLDVQANIGTAVYKTPGTSQQNVSFTLPISPFSIDFNQVSGLRLTALQWNQGGWSIQGELYGQ